MGDFLDHLADPEQRSDGWHVERQFRFTASQMHRLMIPGTRLKTPEELKNQPVLPSGNKSTAKTIDDWTILSDGAHTYIRELIGEGMTGRSDDGGGFATAHGINCEVQAAEHFTAETGFEVIKMGFVPFSTFAGGTPDGEVPEYDASWELKSPYNAKNQIDYLLDLSVETLRVLHFDFFCQIQSNMIFTKRSRSFFVTFDPDQDDHLKMRYLLIEKDADFCKLILQRLELAKKELDRLLEQLKNYKQWIPQKSILMK